MGTVILIGLGANLPSHAGSPRASLESALASLEAEGVGTLARSPFYRTEPVPPSDQPWFVNAVAKVSTARAPEEFLTLLLEVERRFGRRRGLPNAARTLDLDLLAYHDEIRDGPHLVLPHPRLALRRFVLRPLADLAADWRHPRLGLTALELLAALPPGPRVERLD